MRLGLNGISFRKPDQTTIGDTLSIAKRSKTNHPFEGITESPSNISLRGWNTDYDCVRVGTGRKAYKAARQYIQEWQHMQLGWVDTNRPPVKVGEHVIVMAHVLGLLWMRNPLRTVFAREERSRVPAATVHRGRAQPPSLKRGMRFDMGQTTLEGHSLAGEERFSVQWCQEDNSVWYEVYTISRPATLLAFASYPLTRYHQRRFRTESAAAVRDAVENL